MEKGEEEDGEGESEEERSVEEMKVKCTICGKMTEKSECTKLIGLCGTEDGWECPECDEAARNTGKVWTEVALGVPMHRDAG